MKKRFTSAVILFFLTTGSEASGFYVGGGGGPDVTRFSVTSHVSQIHNGMLAFNVKNTDETVGTCIFGTLFAGYGKKLGEMNPALNNLYLAGELNANIDSLQHQNSNSEYVHQTFSTTTYRMPYSFGISLLPGYLYQDNTLFYARVGYVNSKFKISTSDISLTDINRNLSGLRLGLGVQRTLTTHLSLRMEYSNTS